MVKVDIDVQPSKPIDTCGDNKDDGGAIALTDVFAINHSKKKNIKVSLKTNMMHCPTCGTVPIDDGM